jgi:F-type H+-transporting ATPase subunit b
MLACLAAPAIAAAAEEAGGDHGSSALLWQIANFAILVFLLIWFVGPQLRDFLFQRRKQISDQLESARLLMEQAEAREAEWRRKIEGLDAEYERIVSQAKEIGRLEKERLLEQAHRQAARIQEDAARTAEQELARAKAELREEAVKISMGLAEGMLREKIDERDQKRLVEEYLRMIGRTP